MLTASEIDKFCEEGESNHLDFKGEVYPFVEASAHQKSELLKDILAFANARRTVPAYILCGIKKDDSGVMYVTGVPFESCPDDASIQQFVNGKINKELGFITYIVKCPDDKFVWVIEIAVCINERPYYVKVEYGKLPQYCIPIRQGSSTRFATPDDVYKMAMEKISVEGVADFEISIRSRPLGRNQELFAFDFHSDMRRDDGLGPFGYAMHPTNYEEYEYLRAWLSHIPIVIDLKNVSTVCAEDISIKVAVESLDNIARISADAPIPPVKIGVTSSLFSGLSGVAQCRALCAGDDIKKAKEVYLIAEACGDAEIVVTVFCKQLKVPVVKRFPVRIELSKLEIVAEYVNLITRSNNRAERYHRFLSYLLDACNEAAHVSHVDWQRVVREAVHTLSLDGE